MGAHGGHAFGVGGLFPETGPDHDRLRIPISLRQQIEHSARRNRLSLNQEVILWLERAAQEVGMTKTFGLNDHSMSCYIIQQWTLSVRCGPTLKRP